MPLGNDNVYQTNLSSSIAYTLPTALDNGTDNVDQTIEIKSATFYITVDNFKFKLNGNSQQTLYLSENSIMFIVPPTFVVTAFHGCNS